MVESLLGAVKMLDDKRIASRERNKMHARKTRQRKKEHMTLLENSVQSLKERQLNIKLLIKEKNTANILLNMFAGGGESITSTIGANYHHPHQQQQDGASFVDPKVDQLLKRKAEDIPDSSTIPDLQPLILPGHHGKRRKLENGASPTATSNAMQEYPNDGIDYELLGKDRTACSPEELDKIRKERNRMHAKRTRDRKRKQVEEMEKIIKQLEAENKLLEQHLSEITSDSVATASVSSHSSGRVTPVNSPATREAKVSNTATLHGLGQKQRYSSLLDNVQSSKPCQRKTVISSGVSTVSMSPNAYLIRENKLSDDNSVGNQKNIEPLTLPASITTTTNTPTQRFQC
jgi:hypothetical protein